ncbi:MAG: hypothetical protein HOB49_06365 [Gemmatimonadetes bacterium]|nr:hypothetical protein [Gemmatimonadota bacterium]
MRPEKRIVWIGLMSLTMLSACVWHRGWAAHRAQFSVHETCEGCKTIAGKIDSDVYRGPIADTVYVLSNATVDLVSGERIQSTHLEFNGATGLFRTAEFTGRISSGRIQVQVEGGRGVSLCSESSDGVGDTQFLYHASLSCGGSVFKGALIELRWI